DEFNEFGQSLEAEAWHFDVSFDVSAAPLPGLECLIRPALENMQSTTENMNTRKPVEVGLNKYGQRLDEFDEFGQSLEAETWYFEDAFAEPVTPAPTLERMARPAKAIKPVTAGNSTSAAAHRRAA
ncbi:MAG: hypothetical protein PHD01_18720, partial [Geobacteraceae bacterium]|nr:hypothetical protein [Geobacteraceae bacterium]